jgi:soluble P-type ATPase
MLKEAIIGIAVIQKEGLSYEALANSDLVFSSIIDALECLRYPIRLIASLRTIPSPINLKKQAI